MAFSKEYERRRFLEWVQKYAREHNYDYQEIDGTAYWDERLSYSENQDIIRGAYPARKTADQMVEENGVRNTEQYAKYANVEGSRRRAEEVQAARKPSFMDKVKGWKEKNIDEPARRRETEHYFKTQDKIRERQERLKIKQAEHQERELAKQEKALDREAFEVSPAGRAISGGKAVLGGVRQFGKDVGAAGSGVRGGGNTFADSGNLRNMLAPKMNYGGSGSPLMGNQGGGNSVMLGLLTGRSGQSKHPRGHYVTVIDKGVAHRVYTGQAQPGQPYAQPQQPPQQQPGNSLLDRLAMGGNPPLLSQSPGKPAFDYGLTGNTLRDRMKLSNAKYGYSFATKKKMRYL